MAPDLNLARACWMEFAEMGRRSADSDEPGALDAAALEEVRREVRTGLAEGLAPLRQFVDAVQKTMLKAIDTSERIRRRVR